MIVYGWNSFVVATYKPSDIGMDANMDKEVSFERRQKYAHLFWIPFFGIGKVWVLRKVNDSNQYVVHPDVEKVLNYKYPNHSTPWYTFALPILGVAGVILFSIFSMYDSYASKKRYAESEAQRVQEQTAAISDPAPGTYIRLEGNERAVFLKVIGSSANALTCAVSRPSVSLYGDNAILEAFINDGTKMIDTMEIAKADLAKTVRQADQYGGGHEIIPGEGNSRLEKVARFPNPVFASLGGFYDNGAFRALIHNIGAAGKFKDIKFLNDKFQLKSKFPDNIVPGDSLIIEGVYTGSEPDADGTLTIDSAEYDFRIYGSHLIIKEKNHE